MKIFDVASNVPVSGEFILGHDATGSHACYLIYGVLKPEDRGRELKPGKGHEEMLIVVEGEVIVTGESRATLKQGEAIHLRGDETLYAENRSASRAVYVVAGGHSSEGHAHEA